jgi:hypothetical protein
MVGGNGDAISVRHFDFLSFGFKTKDIEGGG